MRHSRTLPSYSKGSFLNQMERYSCHGYLCPCVVTRCSLELGNSKARYCVQKPHRRGGGNCLPSRGSQTSSCSYWTEYGYCKFSSLVILHPTLHHCDREARRNCTVKKSK